MRLLLMPVLLAVSVLLTDAAPAASRGLGVGFMLGEPTGGTAKYWVDQDEAWSFGAGVSFLRGTSLHVQADYLLHFFRLGPELDLPRTPVYLGLGARINTPGDGHSKAGLRLPFGALYLMEADRLELFAEIAPVLDLVPGLRGDLNFGVGLRVYGW